MALPVPVSEGEVLAAGQVVLIENRSGELMDPNSSEMGNLQNIRHYIRRIREHGLHNGEGLGATQDPLSLETLRAALL